MFCLVFVTVLNAAWAGPATAPAGKEVENPVFAAWTKFDEGASCTYETDLDVGTKKRHLKATAMLKKKTADGVILESGSIFDGKDSGQHSQTIPAKVSAADVKKTGEEDVKIGDKTYKCAVYEIGASTMGVAAPGAPTMTVYMSDEVPGGMVKVSGKDSAGKAMSMEITSFKTK